MGSGFLKLWNLLLAEAKQRYPLFHEREFEYGVLRLIYGAYVFSTG